MQQLGFVTHRKGYCHCGCGKLTKIIKWNDKAHGEIRGEPRKFIRGHNGSLGWHPTDIPLGMKWCYNCKKIKSRDDFYPDRSKKRQRLDGLAAWCKVCAKAAKQTWVVKNRERHNKYQITRRLKTKFGVEYEIYEQMFKEQDGKCAICKTSEPTPRKRGKRINFDIDHNHTTGKIRGLLCSKCNVGLGAFNEDIQLLEIALAYLRK